MGGTDPGGASQGGTGGAGAFSTGGFAGVPIGTGGATGGSAGAFGTGGVAGSAGSTGTGGTPPSLPTGTKGFPTNAAECPPELPPSGTSCLLGLACQYPGMLCTCGFDYQMQCTSQQNQCLDQSHCTAGLCHPALHVCTECVDNTHCLDSARPMCRADGVCVQCLTNAECSSFTPICNIIPFSPLVNTCVQCMQDTDCPGDEVCESFFGFCQSPSG